MTEWDELWEKHDEDNPETKVWKELGKIWLEKVRVVGGRVQKQNQNALKLIEEWCSDCLNPKYSCPSCIYQQIKEELGYRPRLSRGETSIESETKRTPN